MDVKGILNDMAERCEKDSSFKQLVENNFGEALKSCGVDSPAQFVQAIKDEGLLTDEDMANVSGGTLHSYGEPNAAIVYGPFSTAVGMNAWPVGAMAVLTGMSTWGF